MPTITDFLRLLQNYGQKITAEKNHHRKNGKYRNIEKVIQKNGYV